MSVKFVTLAGEGEESDSVVQFTSDTKVQLKASLQASLFKFFIQLFINLKICSKTNSNRIMGSDGDSGNQLWK